jgi:hypothetical protein
MTGIELFAYVILPISIGVIAWGTFLVTEWLSRRRHRAGE